MTLEQVEQRRRDISGFVSENTIVSLSDVKTISEKLDIPYEDVRNDVVFLKRQLVENSKKYNLEGLLVSALEDHTRLKELQGKAQDIIEDPKDNTEKLKAIETETNLINQMYHLRNNGIGIMVKRVKKD